ncbi:peptidoglycan-binding protein [Nitrosomonas sp.]|uniref:peptidoglycan-binding domain-containing protein n=1 Tax=Nitrosomonas sp. TaxID=42353 RepID=UPI00374CB40D
MKAIASSIRQFDQGNAVSNLQQALTSLGFLISNDERIASFFGDTTSNALRRFQESFQIPATDSVDENTAKTLNEVLKHKQLLDKD